MGKSYEKERNRMQQAIIVDLDGTLFNIDHRKKFIDGSLGKIYEEHIKAKYDILLAIADRQQVVDMWREQGLVCLQCDKGDF